MEIILAVVIGCMYAGAVYMLLRRSIVKLILGLSLLGQASNLLIFTVGGLVRGAPPVIPEGSEALGGIFADPLPQALILTAIVIGFGAQAFAIVLVKRVSDAAGSDDIDTMRLSDQSMH